MIRDPQCHQDVNNSPIKCLRLNDFLCQIQIKLSTQKQNIMTTRNVSFSYLAKIFLLIRIAVLVQ